MYALADKNHLHQFNKNIVELFSGNEEMKQRLINKYVLHEMKQEKQKYKKQKKCNNNNNNNNKT